MRTTRALVLVVVALLMALPTMRAGPARAEDATSTEATMIYDASGDVIGVEAGVPEESAPQALAQGELAAVSMSEGFEAGWPAPGWAIADLSTTDGGEFLWGKRTCSPHTGLYGGWTVGGGTSGSALACGANYPSNARVRALYGPFNLAGATSASLTYYIRGRLEGGSGCPFDYFVVASGISADGPFQGTPVCGDVTGGTAGNGYTLRTLDLTGRLGQSQVWLAFFFVSDSSINDIGITIDDLSLNVTTTAENYTISGTVRDAGGTAIAGAQVTATPLGAGSPATGQTNANGSYTLTVGEGTYTVQASKQGYTSGSSLTVSVPPNKANTNFTLTLIPVTPTISGTVRDAGGSPISGAQVTATPSGGGSPVIVQSAANGSYTLTVGEGTYSVQASKAGYTSGASLFFTVPPSRMNADLTLTIIPTSLIISGTVRDTGGSPIGGAQVIAFPRQIGQSPVIGQSAADGTYSLSVIAGTYDVQASKSGYFSITVFAVAVPPSRAGVDMSLEMFIQQPTISGTVRDTGGAPLAGAQVTAAPTGGGSPVTAQTAADGTYSMTVNAGTYTIQASKQGYSSGASVSATVPPSRTGVDHTLQSTLPPPPLDNTVFLPMIVQYIQPVAPQPGQGDTFYMCFNQQHSPNHYLSPAACAGSATQLFLYRNSAYEKRDFTFVLSKDIVGSTYTFDVQLASASRTTFEVSAILQHGGSEQTLARTSFTADSDVFTSFVAVVKGLDPNAVSGDTLIVRVRSVSGDDAAILVHDTDQSFLQIK